MSSSCRPRRLILLHAPSAFHALGAHPSHFKGFAAGPIFFLPLPLLNPALLSLPLRANNPSPFDSVIGRHCIIGRNVKIVGSILLDHCVVEDGAKLDGCVLVLFPLIFSG